MDGPRRLNHAELVIAIVLTMAAVDVHAAPQVEVGPTLSCAPGGPENPMAADAIQARAVCPAIWAPQLHQIDMPNSIWRSSC